MHQVQFRASSCWSSKSYALRNSITRLLLILICCKKSRVGRFPGCKCTAGTGSMFLSAIVQVSEWCIHLGEHTSIRWLIIRCRLNKVKPITILLNPHIYKQWCSYLTRTNLTKFTTFQNVIKRLFQMILYLYDDIFYFAQKLRLTPFTGGPKMVQI